MPPAGYYQEALERRFERKWKLLMWHRRACEAAEHREAMFARSETAETAPVVESETAEPSGSPEKPQDA